MTATERAGMRLAITETMTDRLAEVCHRYHVKNLSLFGSVARGEARRESDLDVLVEFEPGCTPGLDFVTLQDELTEIFDRSVDLRTPDDLSRYFRDTVVREAQPVYAVE